MLKVALWGDSIGRGVAFDISRGRYAVLRDYFGRILEREGSIDIENRARFGATAEEGLADFEATSDISASVVAIEYGGNDCNMPWADIANNPEGIYSPKVELSQFEKTLSDFVSAVRERGLRPLLVTPPPLHAPRFFEWISTGLNKANILEFLGDIDNVYRWQERYALAVHRVARTFSSTLFDLRDAFLAQRDMPSLYSPDGMHPNEKGHQLIADAALRFFSSWKLNLA